MVWGFCPPPPAPPPAPGRKLQIPMLFAESLELLPASSSSFKRFDRSVMGLSVLIIATFMERLVPCFKYIILGNSHRHPQGFVLLVPG